MLSEPQIKRLEALLKREAPADGPGAALAVVHQGQLVFKGARGLASIENPSLLSTRSIFNAGSVGKMFTAYCAFALQQQKKLSLDDEVRKVVPELPNYGKPITLRHLLWHTSGLRCYTTLAWWSSIPWRHFLSRKQALELVFRQKELNFEPGSEYLYGNSNYLLLSEVVERVSGKRISELARKLIFEPLGMQSTQFRDFAWKPVKGLVSGHWWDDQAGGFLVSRELPTVAGVGGLFTNAEDLAKWEKFFWRPTKAQLPMLRGMWTQGWTDAGQKIRYGGGLMFQRYRGAALIRHDGFAGGCRVEFCRFPEQGLAIAALVNDTRISPTWLARQAANLILGKVLEPVSALGPGHPPAPPARGKVSKARQEELSGLYRDLNSGAFMELKPHGAGLRLSQHLIQVDLLPETQSGFQGQGPGAIYRLDALEGEALILTKQGRATRFEKLNPLAQVPDDKLAKYAGRYVCPETLSRLEFTVKDGALWGENPGGEKGKLEYLKGGHFYGWYNDYQFTKKGMLITSADGWVRRLKWIRL